MGIEPNPFIANGGLHFRAFLSDTDLALIPRGGVNHTIDLSFLQENYKSLRFAVLRKFGDQPLLCLLTWLKTVLEGTSLESQVILYGIVYRGW